MFVDVLRFSTREDTLRRTDEEDPFGTLEVAVSVVGTSPSAWASFSRVASLLECGPDWLLA